VKGIILAGGTGSRMLPVTKVTNKHLLPVGKKPMIFHAIEKLVRAKITDILVITGTDHMGDMIACLGSGNSFGCQLTYRVQDTAGGIAQALGLARDFCSGQDMCVLLGDNIFEDSLTPWIEEYNKQGRGAHVVLKEVSDPSRYGVAVVANNKLVEIVEKPTLDMITGIISSYSHIYAVTGIYFYDKNVFDIIASLKPSGRDELEITDVNNAYNALGVLTYSVAPGWWSDAGTFPSWFLANQLVMKNDTW